MTTSPMTEVVRRLRAAAQRFDAGERTDAQLLADYLARRDEVALAVLVRRHGPMIWGVCRRILTDYHDAEDAFQATFLVFVRRAASVASGATLASWLYGVALRTARKARATAARRRQREKQVMPLPEPAGAAIESFAELRSLLDAAVSRLPERYRAVLVLCELEGRTRKDAAQALGVPEGTVAGWLARARTLLANRLAHHAPVSCAALTVVLAREAMACVPPQLSPSTILAANLFAAGQATTAGSASPGVVALTQGVLRPMSPTKWTLLALAALLLAVAGLTSWPDRTSIGPSRAVARPVSRRPARAVPALTRRPQPIQQEEFILFDSDDLLALAFSPDSQLLAGGGMDSKVRIWDLSVNKLKATLDGLKGIVRSVAFSPDGRILAAGSDDGVVTLWNVASGKVEMQLRDQPGYINALVFLPEDRLAMVGSDITREEAGKCRITIWDLKKKQATKLCEQVGSASGLACSPDGKLLAAIFYGAEGARVFQGLKVYDLATGKAIWERDADTDFMRSVAFSPDGTLLAVTGGHAIDTGNGWRTEGRMWMLEVTTHKLLWRLAEGNRCYCSLAFTPDGKGVLTGTSGPIRDNTLEGGVKGQKVVSEIRRLVPTTGKLVWATEGEIGTMLGLAAAADGKAVAGSDDDQLMLFDPDTGAMRESLMKWTRIPRPRK